MDKISSFTSFCLVTIALTLGNITINNRLEVIKENQEDVIENQESIKKVVENILQIQLENLK